MRALDKPDSLLLKTSRHASPTRRRRRRQCRMNPSPIHVDTVWSTTFKGSVVSNSMAGCRILVAEDHLDSRLAIVALLEAGGYLVHAVSDGEEALLALLGQAYDLLLTDLWMPDLDGEGLIQTVRKQERYNAMPIILMTASGDGLKRFASRIQEIGRAVQQECRDRSRMPSSA
eukprot:TRINITY_DN33545_c0_g1_i3.p1 TRINITY_DN33545_c0_g1~~TRINITY_DN33545_c0_g1_i3.p1  ORF type:complete len:173 (-),score=30.11 TRINITY_DN33545_c0_g1_i3:10-528(-)